MPVFVTGGVWLLVMVDWICWINPPAVNNYNTGQNIFKKLFEGNGKQAKTDEKQSRFNPKRSQVQWIKIEDL